MFISLDLQEVSGASELWWQLNESFHTPGNYQRVSSTNVFFTVEMCGGPRQVSEGRQHISAGPGPLATPTGCVLKGFLKQQSWRQWTETIWTQRTVSGSRQPFGTPQSSADHPQIGASGPSVEPPQLLAQYCSTIAFNGSKKVKSLIYWY